jgi:hypothetical protein
MQKEEAIAQECVETSGDVLNAEDDGVAEEGSNPDKSTGETIGDAPLASLEETPGDVRDTQRDGKTSSDDNLSDLITDCLFNSVMTYAMAHIRELASNGELQLDEFVRLPIMRSKALQLYQQNEQMLKKAHRSMNPVKDAATKAVVDDFVSCLMVVPASILRDSEPEACSCVVFDDENSAHEIVYSIEVDTR